MRYACSSVVLVLLVGCGHAEDFNGSERPSPSSELGAPCDSDLECTSYCARDNDLFPQGFCTYHFCRGNFDCPDGTVCITADEGVCVYPCSEPQDCSADFLERPGYSCRPASGYNTEQATNVRYQVCLGN